MRYKIINTVDLDDSYAILIKDKKLNGEFVVNSSEMDKHDPELRLFIEARIYFIRSGAHRKKHEVK